MKKRRFPAMGTLEMNFSEEAFTILARNLSRSLNVDMNIHVPGESPKYVSVTITDVIMPKQVEYDESRLNISAQQTTRFIGKQEGPIMKEFNSYRSLIWFAVWNIKKTMWFMHGTINDEHKEKMLIVHIPNIGTFYRIGLTYQNQDQEFLDLLSSIFKGTSLEDEK